MRPAHAACLVAALLASAADGTLLDCVCHKFYTSQISQEPAQLYKDDGLCFRPRPDSIPIAGRCDLFTEGGELLRQTMSVIDRLTPGSDTWEIAATAPAVGECPLTGVELKGRQCDVREDYSRSFAGERVEIIVWDEQTLKTVATRKQRLNQALWGYVYASRALHSNIACWNLRHRELENGPENGTSRRPDWLIFSEYLRHQAQFVSRAALSITGAIVPLVFEEMGERIPEERLNAWMIALQKLLQMSRIKFDSWAEDATAMSDAILSSQVGEDQRSPSSLRRSNPVLPEKSLPLRDDVIRRCEIHLPEVGAMLQLVENVHSYYSYDLFLKDNAFVQSIEPLIEYNGTDTEWQLPDQSNKMVVVDTRCVQLLIDLVDDPPCPLDEVPAETILNHLHCRLQLRKDLALRAPYIPVTSYLAYNQRIHINMCMLSWMIATAESICQDVPFVIRKSVNESRCFFSEPDGITCKEEDPKETICSIARTLLLLKCEDFAETAKLTYCLVNNANKSKFNESADTFYVKTPKTLNTQCILKHKAKLNYATLGYKDFKVDYLKPVEVTLALVNFTFRLLTVVVYMYLPQLRNLPGKLFLCYMLTGLAQVFCTELVYRLCGVPDIVITVQLDSLLTLLGCLWLNVHSYQIFICTVKLVHPDNMEPSEAKKAFSCSVTVALTLWIMASSVVLTLESVSEPYLFHSRAFLLAAICASVAGNLVLLSSVAYMWRWALFHVKIKGDASNVKCDDAWQVISMSLKTIVVSGVGIIVRLGFQQAQGIAPAVYCLHLATNMQGPLLFVLFVCDNTGLPLLKSRLRVWWADDVVKPAKDMWCAAEPQPVRGERRPPQVAETVF